MGADADCPAGPDPGGRGAGDGEADDRDSRWSEIRALLAEALERAPEERPAFVRDACGDDTALARRVESLLRHEGRHDLLSRSLLPDDSPERITDRSVEEEAETPPRQLGPYRLLEKLGDGGMGSVYLAERVDRTERTGGEPGRVAVKILKRGLASRELVARFLAERRILAQLHHPYLVELLDAGTTDEGRAGESTPSPSRPYFVMEHVDGEPVDRYCERHGLSIEARLELFAKICAAVHFAHQNLIVHCDLKPANILVTPDGTPKLLDFGIAKLLRGDPELTGTLTRAGLRPVTPRYASPEQVAGEPISTASDVYSLGVVLYELLTGRPPHHFNSWDPRHVAWVIGSQVPRRPSTAVEAAAVPGDPGRWSRRLRGDLDLLVLCALRRDPRERFDSVDQMAAEVDRHLRGLPLQSRPDSWLYRSGKFVRRHAAAVVAVALGLVLLMGLLGLLAVEQRRADREAVEARRARVESEEVAQFLVDLFEISYAAADGDREPTVLELLEAGAGQLTRDRVRKPATRARLLDALGRAHLELGQLDRAAPLLEAALELRRQAFGERHPEVARSLRSVARLAERRSEIDNAEELYRRTLELRQELLSADDPEVAESLSDLGWLLLAYPEQEEASALLTRAVEILESAPGDQRLRLARGAEGLAYCLQALGRTDEAEERLRQTLTLREEVLGPEHPLVAQGLGHLAWLYRRMGRSTEAVVAYRQAAAIQQRVLGPDHPDLAGSLHNLGMIQSQVFHRHEEAERLLRRAVEINRTALGPDHLELATSLDSLANVLVNQGRFEESVDLFRRSVEIRSAVLGEDHFTVGLTYNNIAHSLRLQGRCDEAEPVIEQARRVIETALGPEDFWAAAPLHELAACRRDQGHLEQAEQLFRRALEILEAQGLGPSHPAWSEVAADFSDLLLQMNKPSEARSLERRIEG